MKMINHHLDPNYNNFMGKRTTVQTINGKKFHKTFNKGFPT